MRIVLYSTGCPRCEILKKKLSEKGVRYEENNSVDAMLELGISQVPVLSVDGKLMNFIQAITWVENYAEKEVCVKDENSVEII